MSVSSPWLRLLLSAAMILNGSVAVGAAMPVMASMGDATATTAASSDAIDCHDVVVVVAPDQTNAESTTTVGAGDPDYHSTPDCCKSGGCQCACAHAAATADFASTDAALLVETPFTVIGSNGDTVKRVSRLDRPPIG